MQVDTKIRHSFEDLDYGDTFLYERRVFMKVFLMGHPGEHNAVELSNGRGRIFKRDTGITPIAMRVVEASTIQKGK